MKRNTKHILTDLEADYNPDIEFIVNKQFEYLDIDGDGQITFKELNNWLHFNYLFSHL